MPRPCAALRVGPARESLRIFPNIVQNLSILSITAYVILCPKMKQKHQCIFWPTFLQMVARVGALDQRILDSARVLGLKQRELLWEVLLPWVMPGILTGLRGSLSSAFMLLTLAEMMGAHSGLGYFIRNFADYANYTNVLAGILLVALVITLLNRAVTALETRLVRWH